MTTNLLGQPVGFAVPEWSGARRPTQPSLKGRYCALEPLDARLHTDDLYAAQSLDKDGGTWTYLSYGPPSDLEEHREMLARQASSEVALFCAVTDAGGRAVGVASYLNIVPEMGSIEIGHLYFSPLLQRTRAATETISLLLKHAIRDLGYRRVEWKCNSLNEGSKAAALRYGFSYEGLFRQAGVSKGHNRDTSWYSILDSEWEALEPAYERWLAEENFDSEGQQRERLSSLTREALQAVRGTV